MDANTRRFPALSPALVRVPRYARWIKVTCPGRECPNRIIQCDRHDRQKDWKKIRRLYHLGQPDIESDCPIFFGAAPYGICSGRHPAEVPVGSLRKVRTMPTHQPLSQRVPQPVILPIFIFTRRFLPVPGLVLAAVPGFLHRSNHGANRRHPGQPDPVSGEPGRARLAFGCINS